MSRHYLSVEIPLSAAPTEVLSSRIFVRASIWMRGRPRGSGRDLKVIFRRGSWELGKYATSSWEVAIIGWDIVVVNPKVLIARGDVSLDIGLDYSRHRYCTKERDGPRSIPQRVSGRMRGMLA